ncbi:MAG: hypothetical protein QGI10_08985 [Vicinamibacterales bacterium]|nr:hypothetical protein [Vicinamibacterales bacterium]MDP7479391.1 hypothetical protein [Vicinamibacterales bacterium]HJN45122.1 hypothetical protein [Vicinamibacterales bacterium]
MSRATGTGAVLAVAALVGAVVLAGSAPLEGGVQTTGTITGVVTMNNPPAPSTVVVNADQAVCGDTVPYQETLADTAGHVANAVVTVAGVAWPASVPQATINNIDCLFVPHVQIAPTRSQLEITSEDDTLHSTHSYDDRNRTDFNIAMPFSGMNVTRPLRRPGVVRVECDSHGWMRGWIVVSNDVGAVSGLDGSFTIDGVPAGTHELSIWHERLGGQPQTVTVTAGATTQVEFKLEQP